MLCNGWPNWASPLGNTCTWNLVLTNKNKSGIGIGQTVVKTRKKKKENKPSCSHAAAIGFFLHAHTTALCSAKAACHVGDATALGPRGFVSSKKMFKIAPFPYGSIEARVHSCRIFFAVIKDIPFIGLEMTNSKWRDLCLKKDTRCSFLVGILVASFLSDTNCQLTEEQSDASTLLSFAVQKCPFSVFRMWLFEYTFSGICSFTQVYVENPAAVNSPYTDKSSTRVLRTKWWNDWDVWQLVGCGWGVCCGPDLLTTGQLYTHTQCTCTHTGTCSSYIQGLNFLSQDLNLSIRQFIRSFIY